MGPRELHMNYVTYTRQEDRGTGIYQDGAVIWMPISGEQAGLKHTWKFNNRFRCTTGKKYFNPKTGELVFPPDPYYYPSKYLFSGGWRCAHGGIMYDNGNRCMQAALSRHFQAKIPKTSSDQDEVGNLRKYGIEVNDENFDRLLRDNNKIWYESHTDAFVDILHHYYGKFEYTFDLREAAVLLSKEIHSKRLLREMQRKEYELTGEWVKEQWVKFLIWKIKFLEIAKAGKDPRVIVDATVGNSLPRVHFANRWKAHTADKEVIFGGKVRVIFRSSPNPLDLRKVFFEAYNSDFDIQIINYSDDAILTIKTKRGIEIYNIDISSNDSSHSLATFEAYAKASGMDPEQKRNLFTVIMTAFKITSSDKKHYCIFKPIDGYLPSGIGDTSTCNNKIYPMLAYTLNKLLEAGYECEISLLTLAGYLMGFRFSYELCPRFEDMQFLKNSPIRRGDEIISVPNLGILFRYSGWSEGDLPTKSRYYPKWCVDLRERAAFHQTLLTFGLFKYYRYEPLIKAFCPYFDYMIKNEEHYNQQLDKLSRAAYAFGYDKPVVHLTQEEVYCRYELDPEDIVSFESMLKNFGYGITLQHKLIDVVLKRDYGLSW